jgi:protein-arginine kinase activator protein McsA
MITTCTRCGASDINETVSQVQIAAGINAVLCLGCINEHSILSSREFAKRLCASTAHKLELDSKQAAHQVVTRDEWLAYLTAHDDIMNDLREFAVKFLRTLDEE